MEVRYEQFDPVTIMGIEVLTTVQGGKNQKDCPALWEKFCTLMAKRNIPFTGKRSFGISYCIPDDPDHFRYVAGVECQPGEKAPEEMSLYTIPGSRYAVFTHSGSVATIGQTFGAIYRDWDRLTDGKRSGDYDFELYNEDYQPDRPDCKTYIYSPIL
ncbi:MAG: GyrI-like domain-containing protein [Thermotogaceae bacterium]|nr:GyrI-like domain-containing protein [Thermotogaceae bacterium]HQN22706.1 GyrI-like domain-containing protein [Thermotogota bacterium]HQQ64969.1 GyrI-like domain-containing protein [Thermotogota bacterium]